jgi:hypothetical protein
VSKLSEVGPFDHTLCICCIHVFSGERPVLLIAREGDYPVEYMCGFDDHSSPNDGKTVGFGHLLEADGTLIYPSDVKSEDEFERDDIAKEWRGRS